MIHSTLHLRARPRSAEGQHGGLVQGMQISDQDLSPEELRSFQQGLASGQLGRLLQPWQPWWLSGAAARLRLTPGGTRAVQPIGKPFATLAQL